VDGQKRHEMSGDGRYSQWGSLYTVTRNDMTVDGRRWSAADRQCNGSCFWRPACRLLEY
jgi:hypothetical protein